MEKGGGITDGQTVVTMDEEEKVDFGIVFEHA